MLRHKDVEESKLQEGGRAWSKTRDERILCQKIISLRDGLAGRDMPSGSPDKVTWRAKT